MRNLLRCYGVSWHLSVAALVPEVDTRSISPCRLTSSTTLLSWRWSALHVFDTRSRRPRHRNISRRWLTLAACWFLFAGLARGSCYGADTPHAGSCSNVLPVCPGGRMLSSPYERYLPLDPFGMQESATTWAWPSEKRKLTGAR